MESEEYFVAAPAGKTAARRPDAAALAGLGMRCGAFLLDYILTLLIPALTLVAAVYIKRRWQAPFAAGVLVAIGYIATAALIFFNFAYLYVLEGQSFGKRLIGIRVVRTDGKPIDYQTALLRHLAGYPLSVLCLMLGALWVLWDSKQQGWHDKLAKTIVVKD
ncbi:MAG: RDD family protein [Blastocatellia bacterium]